MQEFIKNLFDTIRNYIICSTLFLAGHNNKTNNSGNSDSLLWVASTEGLIYLSVALFCLNFCYSAFATWRALPPVTQGHFTKMPRGLNIKIFAVALQAVMAYSIAFGTNSLKM
ncbi:hypothetical protein [Nitrosomonas sp.]|uniref:hypothetical protein n=1 Tax=Nitrosomonas sp. TaxID=42353 RepID=UPI0032EFA304